jgi:D-glycero-D-manno-heptose 1,7-bisphosphate phosphatase
MITQAVVLVGGLGTRLGSHTRDTPKPLLDVGGRPFLSWLVDELRRHGLSDILLLAGFKAERIIEALGDAPDIRIIVEPEPLGTGGALRFAADHLAERFFFLNGDSLFDLNLWDLASAAPEAEATLAVRPLADVSRYGPVVLEGSRIVRFDERPEAPGPGLINGGVGVFSRHVVERIAPGVATSIERDIYPLIAAEGLLAGRSYDRPFIDIGVPEDFDRAQAFVPARLTRGAVIFDRDGVLNEEIDYAHRPDQIRWVEGAIDAIKAVNDAGLFAFVATNQAGVAHGYYGESDVVALHRWMSETMAAGGAHVDAFVYSPYHPTGAVEAYRRDADCRKPRPGMILDLLDRFPVIPSRTVMIGDRPTDVGAARAAGIEGVLFEGGNLLDAIEPIVERLRA